ncbi:hypothetical protein B0H17DRAFT_1231397 [Mycena rosella]|uniref:Uncharacterized protein n=1 Tax=Mycena rosella TaxID=1033263 RepID=A0AAD7GR83_MYCRO|nr:hypothetical protein B0H17DRAFT_1231397 [Mycena rosella]
MEGSRRTAQYAAVRTDGLITREQHIRGKTTHTRNTERGYAAAPPEPSLEDLCNSCADRKTQRVKSRDDRGPPAPEGVGWGGEGRKALYLRGHAMPPAQEIKTRRRQDDADGRRGREREGEHVKAVGGGIVQLVARGRAWAHARDGMQWLENSSATGHPGSMAARGVIEWGKRDVAHGVRTALCSDNVTRGRAGALLGCRV